MQTTDSPSCYSFFRPQSPKGHCDPRCHCVFTPSFAPLGVWARATVPGTSTATSARTPHPCQHCPLKLDSLAMPWYSVRIYPEVVGIKAHPSM